MQPATSVIAYGPDERQRVWVRPLAAPAQLVAVVPGGAWVRCDPNGGFGRAATAWAQQRGMHVATLGYRLLPAASPLEQAEDVARGLAALQKAACDWGSDPQCTVVLSHSAGAHLAALVHVGALQARVPDLLSWRASVFLDTAALDVPQLMRWPHLPLHDRAFGTEPSAWITASPLHQIRHSGPPVLLAVSQARPGAAVQARRFAEALRGAGGQAATLTVELAHQSMAAGLAEGGALAEPIDRFLLSMSSDNSLPTAPKLAASLP